jgi:hypothetical protein
MKLGGIVEGWAAGREGADALPKNVVPDMRWTAADEKQLLSNDNDSPSTTANLRGSEDLVFGGYKIQVLNVAPNFLGPRKILSDQEYCIVESI